MESVLALILLSILFLEYGANLQGQIFDAIKSNPIGLIKYLGASSVLALTFALLPKILISLYMRHNGFWVYEVFGAQSGSLNVIAINVFLNFSILTFGIFISALAIALRGGFWAVCLSICLNVLIAAMFFYMAMRGGDWLLAISVLVFCAILATYVAIWTRLDIASKARYWFIPLYFSLGVAVLLVAFPQGASKLAMAGLRQMKVGGFAVQLYDPADLRNREHPMDAYLLLRTPEALYLSHEPEGPRVYMVSSNHFAIEYKK